MRTKNERAEKDVLKHTRKDTDKEALAHGENKTAVG
jgi:hypothetical protein